jgi:hypothetical protein
VITQRKRIVTGVLIAAGILALMLTMHILVNTFDLFGFIRTMHGG